MKIGENELASELLGEAVKIIDDRIQETGEKETEPNYQRSLSKSLQAKKRDYEYLRALSYRRMGKFLEAQKLYLHF